MQKTNIQYNYTGSTQNRLSEPWYTVKMVPEDKLSLRMCTHTIPEPSIYITELYTLLAHTNYTPGQILPHYVAV